ncbi:MAG: hydrogen gas-evolving membrane-bound hydrogenase subunit E [Acidimicrobiia bacterium]
MLTLLILHLAVALIALSFSQRLGRHAFLVTAVAPISTVLWAMSQLAAVRRGELPTQSITWAPELGVSLDLRLDGLGVVMIALVSGVGSMVFLYAHQYFGAHSRSPARLAATLVVFAGAMLGLVLADNVLWLFICWELTSITSYLLIGHEDSKAASRAAAQHALLVTSAGGLAMLGGLVTLGSQRGTFRLSELIAEPATGTVVTVSAVLILMGAFTKSAQVPFHGWLPGAMAASTPVSAYLHSAAMVKAGVFLVARLGPAFRDVEVWRSTVVLVGAATAVLGGLRAVRQHDLKLLLAFSTVSQLGLLMILFGLGTSPAFIAGSALLLAHGFFKAALFMVVGIIDHQAHTRDLRRLGAMGPQWRPTIAVAAVSAASMAGIPPLAGFIAKEAAIDSLLHGDAIATCGLIGFVGASVLTGAYSIRFVWGAFVTKSGPDRDGEPALADPPRMAFAAPAAVLTVVSIVSGLWPRLFGELVDLAIRSVEPHAHAHLSLWHGFNAALFISAAVITGGIVLFRCRHAIDPIQERFRPRVSVTGAFDRCLRGLIDVADRVAGIAQPGSLPIYLGVVLLTAVALPGYALIAWGSSPELPDLVQEPAHLAVSALVLGGAVTALLSRRRFAAAISLGATGYGMTLLFIVQGAPDLALTQFAIETLTVVLFMLVLRFLPDRFDHRVDRAGRRLRVLVSGAVGVFVFMMLMFASASRTAPPVSEEMVTRSLPDAGGRNIVNVILVDFRGLDTLGEITVLAVAAIGAVSLARVRRTERTDPMGDESLTNGFEDA